MNPPFNQLLAEKTTGFQLNSAVSGSIGVGKIDQFIVSVRKFYLLLPRAGLADNWSKKSRPLRLSIVRDHLNQICVKDEVTRSNVETVDSWLVNRNSTRSSLSQFGARLQDQYGSFCFVCGRRIEKRRTVDHIFPLAFGGDESDRNLILTHAECNSAKNSMIAGDSLHWLSEPIDGVEDTVSPRLRYLVFLRDNFTCTNDSCNQGLLQRTEITLQRMIPTGICCFDNLRTVCLNCYSKKG